MNANFGIGKRPGTARPLRSGDGERSVSVSEEDGVLLVRNLDLFRPGREEFCRRLASEVVGQHDVRSAQISLASGTCRIEFEAGLVGQAEMARRVVKAVRAAIAPKLSGELPGRADPGWTSMMVFKAGDHKSSWETTREGPGSLRLRHQALLDDRALARQVAMELSAVPGIDSCRVTRWGRDLEIRFDPERVAVVAALSAAEGAYQRVLRPAPVGSEDLEEQTSAVATGPRRLWYLTLAGGSFGLTVVGLIVPVIPTVPFLLATSYYLAQSSPTLNRKLLHSKFFGPILSDLETGGGLRRINKIKLIGFTLAVGLVTVALISPPLLILLLMAVVISASIYAITRIPGIPTGSGPVGSLPSRRATA